MAETPTDALPAMPGWLATFKDLRVAGVSLQAWLAYWKEKRGTQTEARSE